MSPPSSSFSAPSYSAPFAVVTDTDHSAWLIIATALGLSWSLLFGAIRVFIRWTIAPGVGLDDVSLAAATVVTIIQSSLVLVMCSEGFGKSIEIVPLTAHTRVQELYYASTIFFIIGLSLSKLSVFCFLLRLTQARHHKHILTAAVTLLCVWTLGSIFAAALQCDLARPWILIGQKCAGALLRWQVICAFDIIIEISFVSMAIYLVWGLHTSKSKKIIVVGAFASRLPMIIIIAFRLATFDEAGLTTNPTLLQDLFVVWTQTELNYSLISATIPSLRPVMNNFNTQFGGLGQTSNHDNYGYGQPGSHPLSNLQSVTTRSVRGKSVPTFDGNGDAYACDAWVTVEVVNDRAAKERVTTGRTSGDATSYDSNDSDRMVIKKDTTFLVARGE